MRTVDGIYASANVFSNTAEDYAIAQVKMICDNEASKGSKIRIMPDVHPGKVGPIGLTMTIGERVLPQLIGIDIGCGVSMMKLKNKKIEFQRLDSVVRKEIPSGKQIRRQPHYKSQEFDISRLLCSKHVQVQKSLCSLSTLGSGNHFLEIDRDEDGNLYAVVHSGSRHLGKEVTDYYMAEGQKYLKAQGIKVPYEVTYLEGDLKSAYLHDLQIVQEFAELNREIILTELAKQMKWKELDYQSCIHNYVDMSGKQYILRKGAISAKKGEPIIIPINMRDGILLGTGLGNPEWNESAPHGSGRILSRAEAKEHHSVSDFKKMMKGVYTSCVSSQTLDEAPFAYRGAAEIIAAIGDTVTISQIIRPVYNFKADGK